MKNLFFLERDENLQSLLDNSSMSSTLSTAAIGRIIENLKRKRNRPSTNKMYYNVWKQFNEFFIRLDSKPQSWEESLTLFVGYLVETNKKSTTIKSYISAIKAVLLDDGVDISEDRYLLTSLTKACKYVNDKVRTRLPIQRGMLNEILRKIDWYYGTVKNQDYLNLLYQSLFSTTYYGLFRVGEVTSSTHPIFARDVHVSDNKNKLLFILRTSKTDWLDSKPQTVKIASDRLKQKELCPFELIRRFLPVRPKFRRNEEPFFIFRDRAPVTPSHMRAVLALMINYCSLNAKLYGVHSLRIGRSVDLYKAHVPISSIRKIGRWQSNTVYHYLS